MPKKEPKQLNVWIDEDLREYVQQCAEEERCGMNRIVERLIQKDKAERSGLLAEASTLDVVRGIIASEVQKANAQLRLELREDREYADESLREWLKKQTDRLGGLVVMAVRHASMGRRLTYSFLSKTHGTTFAKEAYENARVKVREELLPKQVSKGTVEPEEDEAS